MKSIPNPSVAVTQRGDVIIVPASHEAVAIIAAEEIPAYLKRPKRSKPRRLSSALHRAALLTAIHAGAEMEILSWSPLVISCGFPSGLTIAVAAVPLAAGLPCPCRFTVIVFTDAVFHDSTRRAPAFSHGRN